MKAAAVIKHDLKFQFRHGFYHVYVIVTLSYIVFLNLLPHGLRPPVAVLLVFTDPCVLGFLFIGGIVLFEKGQGVFQNLFVTPMRLHDYILSKTLSLSLLSISAAFAIVLFTFGINFNPLLLFIGVTLSAVLFTLIGLTLVVRVETINQYLMASIVYILPLMLPLIEFLGLFSSPLFYLLPAKPSLILIGGAITGEADIYEIIYAVIALTAWIILAYIWVYRWFYRYVINRIGGGSGQ